MYNKKVAHNPAWFDEYEKEHLEKLKKEKEKLDNEPPISEKEFKKSYDFLSDKKSTDEELDIAYRKYCIKYMNEHPNQTYIPSPANPLYMPKDKYDYHGYTDLEKFEYYKKRRNNMSLSWSQRQYAENKYCELKKKLYGKV